MRLILEISRGSESVSGLGMQLHQKLLGFNLNLCSRGVAPRCKSGWLESTFKYPLTENH
jgi:hypothetical protein